MLYIKNYIMRPVTTNNFNYINNKSEVNESTYKKTINNKEENVRIFIY